MADRSSGKLTVAELMARMGNTAGSEDTESSATSAGSHAKSRTQSHAAPEAKTAESGTSEYVPRRLRVADSSTSSTSRPTRASSTPPAAQRSSRRTSESRSDRTTEYSAERRTARSSSSFSWNDIVQDADWSAADKLEAWPHRASGPDTADNPTQRIPAVHDDIAPPRRSPKSPSSASLLDTYSSDYSGQGRRLATAASYPAEREKYPYTAGMDVLSQEEIRAAQADKEAVDAVDVEEAPDTPDAAAEDTASEDTTEDAGSRGKQFFERIKKALGRDTSEENLAATTRILQLAQIVITAVVGGLLFWGFGVLWSKPGLGMITFGLALVVQVTMVVIARALRRREEFWVLILTFIVAFFVTVGPLILTPVALSLSAPEDNSLNLPTRGYEITGEVWHSRMYDSYSSNWWRPDGRSPVGRHY